MKTKKQTNPTIQSQAKELNAQTYAYHPEGYQVVDLDLEDGRTIFAVTEKFCNRGDEVVVIKIKIMEIDEYLKYFLAPEKEVLEGEGSPNPQGIL